MFLYQIVMLYPFTSADCEIGCNDPLSCSRTLLSGTVSLRPKNDKMAQNDVL
jgi:hypothetical protein